MDIFRNTIPLRNLKNHPPTERERERLTNRQTDKNRHTREERGRIRTKFFRNFFKSQNELVVFGSPALPEQEGGVGGVVFDNSQWSSSP